MKIKLYAYAGRITMHSQIHISVLAYEHAEPTPFNMMPVGEFEIDLPIPIPTVEEFNTFLLDAKKRARLERIEDLRKQLEALDSLPTDAYDQITQAGGPKPLL